MNKEQKDMVVAEHLEEFCVKIAREVGDTPIATLLILEWPDSNGSLGVQMLPTLDRPMMLKVLSSLERKFAGAIQMMRTKVNTVKAAVPEKKETIQ